MKRDAFTLAPDDVREIRHFHLFCGLGGGAKGFSGLLNETRSKTAKYQALNCLTLRGAWRAGFSPEQIALAIAAAEAAQMGEQLEQLEKVHEQTVQA